MSTKLIHILTSVSLALSLAAWSGTASMAYAAAGGLDTSFDGDGKQTTPIGSDFDNGYAVALQPDGKIVVAGDSAHSNNNNDFAVVRYNADGSLDTSFDGDGKQTTPIGSGEDYGRAVALQPDGKIVIAGSSFKSNKYDFAVVRYNADGSLDTSFDSDGKQTTPFGSKNSSGNAIALQPDGKIVVAGGSNNDFAVVRYNADGSLDTSFDGDGKQTTSFGSGIDEGHAVALQPDGKIIVAGRSRNSGNYEFAVVRYNADGSLDISFDGDGKQTTPIGSDNSSGNAVALQPNGKIIVAGKSRNSANYYDFAIVRYNADGSLDTSFDSDGKQTNSVGSGDDHGRAVALQPDGKIIVAGVGGSFHGDFAVVRYNTDGSLDTSFDGDGKQTTSVSSQTDGGHAVVLQPDGKIIVAGESYDGVKYSFAVVRYDGGLTAGSSANVTASISLTAFEALLSLFAHNISFPPIVMLGADKIVDAADYAWQTSDKSAAAAGWHVTLSANDFSDGSSNSIPVNGFTVEMANTAINKVSGNAPPTSQVTSITALSPTGINLLSAAAGDGLGTYNFVPHFQLIVPGTTVVSDYNTAVTVTVISGP